MKEIIDSIKAGKIKGEDGALKKFEAFLEEIMQSVKPIAIWNGSERKMVHAFGELFNKINGHHPAKFLDALNKAISEEAEKNKIEALSFIKAEIIWNFFPHKKENCFVRDFFEDLIKSYPTNPEFHHAYSNYLEECGNLADAVGESRLALQLSEEDPDFRRTAFNKETSYLDMLIAGNHYEEAKKFISDVNECRLTTKEPAFNNALRGIEDRITDHLLIRKKIDEIDKKISEKVEESRNRLIEVLGVFAAMFGFAVTSVQIAIKFTFQGAALLIAMMAVVFIIFAISISYVFQKDKIEWYKEGKFWVLIACFVCLSLSVIYGKSLLSTDEQNAIPSKAISEPY